MQALAVLHFLMVILAELSLFAKCLDDPLNTFGKSPPPSQPRTTGDRGFKGLSRPVPPCRIDGVR